MTNDNDKARGTFLVRIGNFNQEYRIYETTAPQDYDGFGTISLHDYPPEQFRDVLRWVLVRTEHETWQIPRYRSGLYQARLLEGDDHDMAAVEAREKLYSRMLGSKAK